MRYRLLLATVVTSIVTSAYGQGHSQQVLVSGSYAGELCLQNIAAAYNHSIGSRRILVSGCDFSQCVHKFAQKQIDVLRYSGLLSQADRKMWVRAWPPISAQPRAYLLGKYVVYVVVNKNNPIDELTIDDLGRIYAGKIGKWSQIKSGLPEGEIVLCGESGNTNGCYIFTKKIMANHDMVSRCQLFDDTNKILSTVSSDVSAIGFVMHDDSLNFASVKIMAIRADNCGFAATPSVENVFSGAYPVADELWLIAHPDAPEVARSFCEYAISKEAFLKSKERYLKHVYEYYDVMLAKRLAEMKAGKGVRMVAGGLGGAEFGRDLATEYVKVRAAVQLVYSAQQPNTNISNFLAGNYDFLIESAIPDETLAKSKDKWAKLAAAGMKQKPFAARAAAVVVNAANPVASLTADQIKEILSGKATDWSAFAAASDAESQPAATKISLLGLAASDATMSMVAQKISPARFGKYDVKKDAAALLTAVATDPGAIAIMDLTQVPADNAAIKILPIGDAASPVAPSIATLRDGSYPLASLISIYYLPKPDPAPALVPATAPTAASAPTTTSAPTSAPAPDQLTELFRPLNQPVVAKSMTPSQTKEDFFNFITAVLPDETSQPAGESSPAAPVASKPAVTNIMTADAAASLQETLRKHGLVSLACPTIAQPSSAATQPAK